MSELTRRSFLSAVGAAAVSGLAADARAADSAGSATRPTATSDISASDVDPQPEVLEPGKQGQRPHLNFRRVRPKEFKGDLLNPHIGTQTFQRFNGDALYPGERWDDSHGPETFPAFTGKTKVDHYPETTVAYCRWVWSVLEPAKGQYRWDIIDGALKSAADRGQTLHVRLQPFAGRGLIPKWFWDLGGARVARNEPDSNNPLYIEHFGNLIREFGKKYDGHPTLEAFDIAYAGAFGEMGGNATPETAANLVDIYVQSLPRTQLVAMMGTLGCIYAMKLDRPIGWRADCFGDLRAQPDDQTNPELRWNEMEDAYPRQVAQAHAQDQWKIAPVTWETCGTVGSWANSNYDLDFIIEQGLKYHPSLFMPKSCAFPEKWWDKLMAFNRRLGYRFVVRQFDLPQKASAGETIRLSVWIDNVGVAPIYWPYKLALRFTQGSMTKIVPFKQDIRKWLPDNTWFAEHLELPRELKQGNAQIDMGIIDDAGQAKVKLAIESVAADGWHPMCPIEIR